MGYFMGLFIGVLVDFDFMVVGLLIAAFGFF